VYICTYICRYVCRSDTDLTFADLRTNLSFARATNLFADKKLRTYYLYVCMYVCMYIHMYVGR
jgi:hypothetical protein